MKQAIVLGITGGLGKEIARMLLEKGYKILGTSHTRSMDEEYDQKKVEIVQLDFANREQIEEFCKRIDGLESVDFVTNTIGACTVDKFEKIPVDAFRRDFDVNMMNYIPVLQRIVPKLKGGSEIVFILTEMVVGEPPYFYSSYLSSKYALLGLMKDLAGELKQRGVKVNAVSPGMMDTKFSEKIHRIVKERYIKESVHGRLVTPKEVVFHIDRLMESDSTGENILVFGKRVV